MNRMSRERRAWEAEQDAFNHRLIIEKRARVFCRMCILVLCGVAGWCLHAIAVHSGKW